MIEITQDWITIIFRVLGVLIVAFGVIPKAYREAKIRDGIFAYRKLIFLGILIYAGSAIALLILTIERVFFDTFTLVSSVSMLNGVETTAVSTILYLLYSKKYGEEQK